MKRNTTDPFGASATYPAMFADMGFDAFIINRIHYELKTAWQASKGLEFTWRGTPSRNNTADMFTHVLDSHYSAPWGFDFEYIQASPSVDPFSNAVTNPPLRATNTSFMYPANIEDRCATVCYITPNSSTHTHNKPTSPACLPCQQSQLHTGPPTLRHKCCCEPLTFGPPMCLCRLATTLSS